MGTTRDLILYSTADTVSGGAWVTLASGVVHNQFWETTIFNNRLILAGNALTDPLFKFDVVTTSFTKLQQGDFVIRAKHVINSRNQLIAANILDISSATVSGSLTSGATYYASRFYFSDVLIDTFAPNKFIDVRVNDGEEITGLGEKDGIVDIFKESTISGLTYSILNLTSLGGNQTMATLVEGFGLYAPRTLANVGVGYILGSKDGIRFWDGGQKTRLQVEQESRPISTDIKPLIDKLIRAGTYRNSVGYYYPKRQWYIYAFEDPEAYPRGKLNSILVYDLNITKWFRFKNWNAASFTSLDGPSDNGELLFGYSTDGFVDYGDLITSANDAPKTISIDPMDSSTTWKRSSQEVSDVQEGTASIRLTMPTILMYSSATNMALFNLGEWYDKSRITKADTISFRVKASSGELITGLNVALEINDISNDFDANFTSVTISSGSFVGFASSWTTISIPISSFPILSQWTALDSEQFPFANTFTFYGIRFLATGTAGGNVLIDDLRMTGAGEQTLNAYWFTKQWNFGSARDKTFHNLFLNAEAPADTIFYIDVYKNFGEFTDRKIISGKFTKDIFVAGYGGSNNITKLSSVDFAVKFQTATVALQAFAPRPMVADESYIYAGDQYNNRIFKVDKSSFSVFSATFGALGPGTSNFNLIYQMAVDDKYLYVCDFGNNRVKVHDKKTLAFVNSFGQLGQNTTSFHNPTGVAVDDAFLYTAQDGNYSILKLSKSSGGYVSSIALNLNTIGDMTLAVDELYLYVAYNSIAPTSINNQEVVLEKRFKSSLELVNKTSIFPSGSVALSTYSLQGDISISDDYIYVSFTDDANANGFYYIQKRLKSDFSIIREYKNRNRHFAVAANGLAFKAKRQTIKRELGFAGAYLQLRYSEDQLDNGVRFFNHAFEMNPQNR